MTASGALAWALLTSGIANANPSTLPAGHADYQLGGAYAPAAGVTIVARDRTEQPAPGLYSICYVNAFQTQPHETAWWKEHHPGLLLRSADGGLVEDENWPGELLLDTSTAEKRDALLDIMRDWTAGCRDSGFQAAEPDNLDSWQRSKGRLKKADNLEFARLLAVEAHALDLAIAQKNAAEVSVEAKRKVGFDFAVAESCQVYAECDAYLSAYGDRVIEIEYTDTGRAHFDAACAARGDKIPVVLRDRDLSPARAPGYRFEAC